MKHETQPVPEESAPVDSDQRCPVCGEPPCDNPHKRFTVILKIDAHSWEEAARYIEEFAEHVVEHGQACQLISSGRGWIKVIERPEQTEANYDEQLERWFQARRSVSGTATGEGSRR
jgi:hypothetical protein